MTYSARIRCLSARFALTSFLRYLRYNNVAMSRGKKDENKVELIRFLNVRCARNFPMDPLISYEIPRFDCHQLLRVIFTSSRSINLSRCIRVSGGGSLRKTANSHQPLGLLCQTAKNAARTGPLGFAAVLAPRIDSFD